MGFHKKALFLLLLISVPIFADSWVFSGRAKISWIMQWESEGSPTFFQLSSGHRCYVPAEDKRNYALIQTLYVTQRSADIHCYSQVYNFGGESAHKLHRVIAFPD